MSNSKSNKYNNANNPFLDILRFYETKTGKNLRSMPVDAAAFDALQKVQIGSRLFIELVPVEKRKGEKSPHARLKLIVDEAGASASSSTAKASNGSNGRRTYTKQASAEASDI